MGDGYTYLGNEYIPVSKGFFGPDAKSLMPPPSVPSTQEEVDEYKRSNPKEIEVLHRVLYDMMKWYFIEKAGIINTDGTINRVNAIKMWPQFEGESDIKLSALIYKKLRDISIFASLYYLPCKTGIPGLTIDEFALAFLLYYMSAKGGEWNNDFNLGNLGMDVQRIQQCQIFLTNFDTLSPLVELDGVDNPMELTRTIQRNYGGKRRKSRKIRKTKKRKGIKQKSRRSISR